MLIQMNPIFSHNDQPVMVLKRYSFDTAKLPLKAARNELLQKIAENSNDSNTWGYFPELKDDFHYAASKALARAIERDIVSQDTHIARYPVDLAFVRLATTEPKSDFGGFHVDVSPGIAHEWSKTVDPNANILRILFNVHSAPRFLDYYPYDADDLQAKGYDIPRNTYKILDFPDLKPQRIAIPPIEKDAVYALQFLSDHVPHAGMTGDDGHFLVSFGGYIPSVNPFAD